MEFEEEVAKYLAANRMDALVFANELLNCGRSMEIASFDFLPPEEFIATLRQNFGGKLNECSFIEK